MRTLIACSFLFVALGARASWAQPESPPAKERALVGRLPARGTPHLPAAKFRAREDRRQDMNLRVSFKVRYIEDADRKP